MVNNIRLIVLTLIILSCEKSNDNDNPFIPDVRFEKNHKYKSAYL